MLIHKHMFQVLTYIVIACQVHVTLVMATNFPANLSMTFYLAGTSLMIPAVFELLCNIMPSFDNEDTLYGDVSKIEKRLIRSDKSQYYVRLNSQIKLYPYILLFIINDFLIAKAHDINILKYIFTINYPLWQYGVATAATFIIIHYVKKCISVFAGMHSEKQHHYAFRFIHDPDY